MCGSVSALEFSASPLYAHRNVFVGHILWYQLVSLSRFVDTTNRRAIPSFPHYTKRIYGLYFDIHFVNEDLQFSIILRRHPICFPLMLSS